MPDENLHITLVPPKEMSKYAVKVLLKQLCAVKFQKFGISFNKISFGPDKKAPRLIWVSGKAPGNLIQLKDSILSAIGEQAEAREFIMHLTLARFREEAFKEFPQKEFSMDVDWKMEVREFSVIQSELFQEGARYTVLGRSPV